MREIINYGCVIDVMIWLGWALFLAVLCYVSYNIVCGMKELMGYLRTKTKKDRIT